MTTESTALCWGFEDDGTTLAPEGNFTRVAAGFYHSCGLREDGSVVCWGRNGYGEGTPPEGLRL